MKPTIYDVAREAGVSIATVSKVINNSKGVGKVTREKVLKVMEELQYKPSVVASALTGKGTSAIGFLVPDLANPFVAEVARKIEDRGHEKGLNFIICSTDFNEDKEEKCVSLLKQKSVDGFILFGGFKNEDVIKSLIDEQIPVVLLAEDYPSLPVSSVKVDDFLGGYQVTSHLISLGHKKIAVIAEEATSSKERIRGFRQAMQDHGLKVDESLVRVCSISSPENGQRITNQLLNAAVSPSAIFACNDLLAIGAILGAREHGIKIPEELSIVGFDNTILSKSSNPPLTTVEQPIQDMSLIAMDLLENQIEGKEKLKQRIILLPKLIIRDSTAKWEENL